MFKWIIKYHKVFNIVNLDIIWITPNKTQVTATQILIHTLKAPNMQLVNTIQSTWSAFAYTNMFTLLVKHFKKSQPLYTQPNTNHLYNDSINL